MADVFKSNFYMDSVLNQFGVATFNKDKQRPFSPCILQIVQTCQLDSLFMTYCIIGTLHIADIR